MRLTLNSPGSNVQFYQSSVAVDANTDYILTFDAYSSTGHDIDIHLLQHVSPYSNYGLNTAVDLVDTGWNSYSIAFTTNGLGGRSSVTDGRFRFWLAPYDASGDVYFIDNIVLAVDTGTEPPSSATNIDYLMKFSVSGVGARSVQNAKLRIYCVNGSDHGGDFRQVTDNSWSEGSVTWNNAPAADPTIISSLGGVNSSTWYEVDLVSMIDGDGTYSIRVRNNSENGADYNSTEASSRQPELILTVQ